MSGSDRDSSSHGSRADMRRTPRIDVRQRLRGHLVTLDRPVVMRDFSQGGFSVESDQPIPSGTHIVRIQEGERWSVTVTAASRHAQTPEKDDGSIRYVMGFEYEDQSDDTKQTTRVL